jgi:hypothetical protein
MDDQLQPASADPAAAEVFDGLAKVIYASNDFTEVYTTILAAAPQLVPGCDHASLMLYERGRYATVAASDDIARAIDSFERELGEGPCLNAIAGQPIHHQTDLRDDPPWPRLAARVLAETPVRAMSGFRLQPGEDVVGALNMFADRAGALTADSIDQGIVLASFVTVALAASIERKAASTLRAGLQSNREIGKAMGLMMAFHKISDDEAFEMLRKASQDMNMKLSEVARQVVDHHNRV